MGSIKFELTTLCSIKLFNNSHFISLPINFCNLYPKLTSCSQLILSLNFCPKNGWKMTPKRYVAHKLETFKLQIGKTSTSKVKLKNIIRYIPLIFPIWTTDLSFMCQHASYIVPHVAWVSFSIHFLMKIVKWGHLQTVGYFWVQIDKINI